VFFLSRIVAMVKMVKTLNNILMAETRRTNVRLEILSTKKDTGNESRESRAGGRAPLTLNGFLTLESVPVQHAQHDTSQ
jgi:hypothetical protein